MKVDFRHQLTIKYSRVIEALSVICSLANDSDHKEVQDLTPFEDLRVKHATFFEHFDKLSHMRFAWLEFALLSFERESIDTFVSDIMDQTNQQCLVTLLGYEIDLSDAAFALQVDQNAAQLIKKLGYDDRLIEIISKLPAIMEAFYDVMRSIDAHDAFNLKISMLLSAGEYDIWLDQFMEGTSERHPLSYAQELMGKPFWNIADYSRYEFIPVYFVSPYSMRLMNGETMIYIHGLQKRGKSPEEQLENILDPLKSISDGTRLKILRMLYMHPMYGKEIADALNLTTATVSHHLEALYQNGLVNVEKVKQIKYFSTNYTALGRKLDDVTKYIKDR